MVKSVIDFVMDILETVVFIGSLFIVIYLFVMQPNQVRGASDEPTFSSGDYILTSKITYKLREPERGDVIVFKSPKNPDIEYIKRVIGLPGDQITIKNGDVFVNGVVLQEDYISAKTSIWEGGYIKEGEPIIIPDDKLFVLGDNRPRSSDSREFGLIPVSDVIGVVFYRYFPSNKIGVIRNPLPKDMRDKEIGIPKTNSLKDFRFSPSLP